MIASILAFGDATHGALPRYFEDVGYRVPGEVRPLEDGRDHFLPEHIEFVDVINRDGVDTYLETRCATLAGSRPAFVADSRFSRWHIAGAEPVRPYSASNVRYYFKVRWDGSGERPEGSVPLIVHFSGRVAAEGNTSAIDGQQVEVRFSIDRFGDDEQMLVYRVSDEAPETDFQGQVHLRIDPGESIEVMMNGIATTGYHADESGFWWGRALARADFRVQVNPAWEHAWMYYVTFNGQKFPEGPLCPGDVNGNGEIDVGDVDRVVRGLGTDRLDADVNRDGSVDTRDLTFVLHRLGTPCE